MKFKNDVLMFAVVIGFMMSLAACSDVAFGPGPNATNASQSVGGGGGGGTGTQHSETFDFNNNPYAGQVDILFVVDNSGSMSPLQNNMTSNFSSFMNAFLAKNFDYHLAVTTTEAYLSLPQFQNNPAMAQFSNGLAPATSGVYDITVSITNPVSTFVTNASLGSGGSGDERAFSSLQAALNSPLNSGFLRPNSFFAIVILSDEDDFSDPTRPEYSWLTSSGIVDHDYQNPTLESVDSYVSYLDTLTGSTPSSRRYSVSAMSVLDPICKDAHVATGSETSIIGQRYIDMVNGTGGEMGSICDSSYGTDLSNIANRVIQHTLPAITLAFAPIGGTVSLTITPADATLTWTISGQKITFDKMPALGTTIVVNYLSK